MAIYQHVAVHPKHGNLKTARHPPYDVMVKRAICYLKFKGGATKKAILKHILKNNLHVKKYTIIARLTNCLGRMLKAKVIKKEKNRL